MFFDILVELFFVILCLFRETDIFIGMERDNNIIEMYNSGTTATEISKILNIGRRTVYRVLDKTQTPLNKTKIKKCLICYKQCQKNICGTCNTNLRRYRVKLLAVEYLGNKCNRCNWSGDLSGFDIHHKNPKEKEFNPSAVYLANMSWDKVKKEIDKCELLCALCYRKEHSNYDCFKELVLTYKGKTFK
jgi:hypothetical protein